MVCLREEDQSQIVCTKCHENISIDAERCPQCGFASDDRTTVAAIHNHPIGLCAGYEYIETEKIPTKLQWEDLTRMSESSQEAEQCDEEDTYDKLRKVKKLREDGILSESEFQRKKQELLDQL